MGLFSLAQIDTDVDYYPRVANYLFLDVVRYFIGGGNLQRS